MSKTRELFVTEDYEEQSELQRTVDLLEDAKALGPIYDEVMRMIREDNANLQQVETFVDEVIRDFEEMQYSQPENEKPRG